ncbi:hypothetical protein BH09BAC1_BH09BAC1_01390 [soil metagenome]
MRAIFYTTMMIGLLGMGMASAQTSMKNIREEVIDVELLKNWKTGETKNIQNQNITKLKDDGDGTTRTNLMYSPPSTSMFMHPTLMVMPIEVAKAGTIYIMVDRENEEAVNARNYTVQIFDKSGMVELYAVTPKNSPGQAFKYGIYFNQFGIEVPAIAGNTFNVVVTDNTTGKKVTYFVNNTEKSTMEMDKRFAGR